MSEFVLFAFLLFTANKANSSVCFWENLRRANLLFEINWPLLPISFFWYIYLKFGAKIRRQARFLATTLSCTNFWCQTLNICIGEREKGSQQWLYTMQCPSKLDRWFLLFRPPLLAFFTTGDLLQMGKLGRFHSNKNRCCFCNKARAQHCT